MTSDQSNLTKRPHDRRTWTVQTYSPDGANVQRHLIMSFGHSLVHNPNGVSMDSATYIVLRCGLLSNIDYSDLYNINLYLCIIHQPDVTPAHISVNSVRDDSFIVTSRDTNTSRLRQPDVTYGILVSNPNPKNLLRL